MPTLQPLRCSRYWLTGLTASIFRSCYRAVARDVPDPGLIKREIAVLCPNLDFGILEFDDIARSLPN